MGSPFPVFFSAASTTTTSSASAYPNMVTETMPSMPNYTDFLTSGAFPSLLGLVPSSSTGASGEVILLGVGPLLGEICREHISGKCRLQPARGGVGCRRNRVTQPRGLRHLWSTSSRRDHAPSGGCDFNSPIMYVATGSGGAIQ
ncbi:uncharacterized protein [Lolium perenne]|nr:uncharacterized protein LOC127300898 isoform X3 [Lolium perenne]